MSEDTPEQWRSEWGELPPCAALRWASQSCQRFKKYIYMEKFLKI